MQDKTERENRLPGQPVVLELNLDELAGIAGGLREALEELDAWEFDTRVGMSIPSARALMQSLVVLSREYRAEISQT